MASAVCSNPSNNSYTVYPGARHNGPSILIFSLLNKQWSYKLNINAFFLKRYYIASARELVRINGTTKAPIMNYTAESMLGVVTIRAFAMTKRFIQNNLQLIDTDAALFFHTIAALEWVLLRVEALQILIIITASVFLVFLTEGTTAPGAALT